jgi:hypothetical protein
MIMSLFGGIGKALGGGGIFGSLMNIASMMFPPLAIANSLANLVTQAVGGALKNAADILMKESGMPKFLADGIKDMADNVTGQQQSESSPDVDAYAKQEAGDSVQKFQDELTNQMVESARKHMEETEDSKDSASGSGTGRSKGKQGASSWLAAMAKAMGEVLGKQASKMVGLSHDISAKMNAGGSKEAQQKAAQQGSAMQSELQGVSQMFAMLQSAFNNTLKSLGEGLTQMARKG